MAEQTNSETTTSNSAKSDSSSIIPDTPATSTSTAKPSSTSVEKDSTNSSQNSKTSPTKNESDPIQEPEKEIPLEKRNSQLYKIGIGLFLIIFLVTVGIFYMRTQLKTITIQEITLNASPSPELQIAVEDEIIELEKSKITLEILNGTSTPGLAGKTSDIFEELGYEVKRVGNADNIEKSQIYVKTEFSDQIKKILDDVKDELDITEITEEVDDLDTTVKIILGTK